MTLSDEQKRIVAHPRGRHARVLAGPGTGKSFTSVALFEELLVADPGCRIQAVTFARTAAREFQEKIDAHGALGTARSSTVHGFALQQLLKHKAPTLPMPLRVAGEWEEQKIIQADLLQGLKTAGHKVKASVVSDLLGELSAGWESLDPEKVLHFEADPALAAAFYGLWQEHRWFYGYTLKGELTYQAGQHLADVPEASVDIDVLLVDEYQDLNRADIRLIEQVAARGADVVAVGDDDQSLYSFRNAAPDGILKFLDTFSGAADYQLTLSQRCGPRLLSPAMAVIAATPRRPAKAGLTFRPDAAPGEFAYLRFDNDSAEIEGLADLVQARIEAGVEPNKIALLARTGAKVWAKEFAAAFEIRGLKLASSVWVREVLAEDELRRAIALGLLTQNREDSLAWRTLIDAIPGFGQKALGRLVALRNGTESFAQLVLRQAQEGFGSFPPALRDRLASCVRETTTILDALDLRGSDLDATGWGGWLLAQVADPGISADATRLLTMVGEVVPVGEGLGAFLAQLEPTGTELAENEPDSVRLMTMVRSKGLTLDTTVILGAEDEILPFERDGGMNLAEEHRIVYVAMTRATALTVVSWVGRRNGALARRGRGKPGAGRRPSRLLSIPGVPRWVPGPGWLNSHIASLRD